MTRVLAMAVLVPVVAFGHAFDPALLDVRERGGGLFDVVWKTPVPQGREDPARRLTPVFSTACRRVGDVRDVSGEVEGLAVFRLDCGPAGLRGQTIEVGGLVGHPSDVLVRVRWLDGPPTSTVLRGGAATFVVPGVGTGLPLRDVLWRYGALGTEHILGGIDHLLFVLGLLLLVRGWGAVVRTVTAFTVAHTITLGLAVLGVVRVPPPPVEALIAVSIVLVAVEALRPPAERTGLAHRAPWLVAFAFGLLHGLGFAGALTGLGLPPDHVPAALVAFNLGVEAGQLAFIAVMLGPVWALERAPAWVRAVPAYAIGAVAVAWTLDRVLAFWS